MLENFMDEDLGTIIIRQNVRAKSVIARRKEDHILLTIPTSYTLNQVKKALEEMKSKLLLLDFKPKCSFTPETTFNTISFGLLLRKGTLTNYYSSLKDRMLTISIPSNCEFEDKEVQTKIRELIETALRKEAKYILPNEVRILAEKYGFQFSKVKINKSRTRWGSCSHKKSINLSYFCLLLPPHLVELIILHELCHTREMNHGERFWTQLDRVTNGKAKLYSNELKRTTIHW